MKLVALISGGKDSTYTAQLASEKHELKYLVTIIPKKKDSYMYHSYGLEVIDLFAKATGVPLIKKKSSGVKEKELKDLELALMKIKEEIDGVVNGAISSVYQKSRIDRICKQLGLKSLSPLWHQDPEKILKEEVKKFETMIISVSAEGFDQSWLGRKIDNKCINDLRKLSREYGIQISGEGGDYETLTLNAPLFQKRIEIAETEEIWEDLSGYLKINKARLVSKNKKRKKFI